MRQSGTDRRAMRTRRLLADALIDLMRTRRYAAITVSEIAEAADVGRSTFYAHFTDKDDLMVQGLQHMVGELQRDEPGPRNTLSPSLGLFHHVAGARDLYLTMSRERNLYLALDALQGELSAMFLERLQPRLPAGPTRVPAPLLAAMTAGMLVTAVRAWLESDMSDSAETVNRSFVLAAEAAIRAGVRPVE